MGRDHSFVTILGLDLRFQSTRPVWGATVTDHPRQCIFIDFNPRAPCGARRSKPTRRPGAPVISIHAPRVGRDGNTAALNFCVHLFQSTRPVWGATEQEQFVQTIAIFQSTRPVWGATVGLPIGCRTKRYFNPRAPCGARPMPCIALYTSCLFQSTRPVWGATTFTQYTRQNSRKISIHAPRVGRDQIGTLV